LSAVKRTLLIAALLLLATPVSTAGRSVDCDVDQRDSQGEMYVRYQRCLVETRANHVEITMDTSMERWVMDLPNAEKRTTSWTWWNESWHRTPWYDRLLWSGSVKTDQLTCRYHGTSKIRYVFSDDTAICLLQ
jgi:hypothetical protein